MAGMDCETFTDVMLSRGNLIGILARGTPARTVLFHLLSPLLLPKCQHRPPTERGSFPIFIELFVRSGHFWVRQLNKISYCWTLLGGSELM